jgi:glycine betaine/proline transport system ATP-binding protein
MSAALEFRGVDVIYPRATGREGAEALRRALAALTAGTETAQVAADCGVTVAVRDASLSVAPGEICVVMGLSGSGKSTLLRTANGLTRATRGEVLLGGPQGQVDIARCDAAALSAARRRRISMVFQQAALLPWRCAASRAPSARASSPRSSNSWGSPTGPSAASTNCRGACSSGWVSRAPSPPRPTSC